METEFDVGAYAFIIESNHYIREVNVVKRNGDFYIVRFQEKYNGGVQLRGSRLFASKEEAESYLPARTKKKIGFRSPYDYGL